MSYVSRIRGSYTVTPPGVRYDVRPTEQRRTGSVTWCVAHRTSAPQRGRATAVGLRHVERHERSSRLCHDARRPAISPYPAGRAPLHSPGHCGQLLRRHGQLPPLRGVLQHVGGAESAVVALRPQTRQQQQQQRGEWAASGPTGRLRHGRPRIESSTPGRGETAYDDVARTSWLLARPHTATCAPLTGGPHRQHAATHAPHALPHACLTGGSQREHTCG